MRCVAPHAAFYAMPSVALPPGRTDEDFVLDRIGPLVVASPCSGHGFKFAPLIGEVLAMAEGRPELLKPITEAPVYLKVEAWYAAAAEGARGMVVDVNETGAKSTVAGLPEDTAIMMPMPTATRTPMLIQMGVKSLRTPSCHIANTAPTMSTK